MPEITGSKLATGSKSQSQPCDKMVIRREAIDRWFIEWVSEGICTAVHRCDHFEAATRIEMTLNQMEPLPDAKP
jgi:hypothetical protein